MTNACVSDKAKQRAFQRAMLRLVLLGAAALTLISGCRTSTLKGTPFFSNDPARVGAAEDRVNIWPLLYYRSPALSVLWPIGEFTDECTAIRPLFSMYREAPEAPYTEFNILWPIAKFDTRRHENRIFPFFWGNDDFVGFPLYWHFGPFTDDSGTDALFPLWIYNRRPSRGHSLHLAWPFIHDYDTKTESGRRVFPLFSTWDSKTADAYKRYYLAYLLGFEKHPEGSIHWLIPFYATGRDETSSGFLSLPWCDFENADRRLRIVPPLLSWQNDRTDGSRSRYFLLGLGRDAEDANGQDSGYFIPFYSYGEDYFHSLLYSHAASEGKSLDIIPPLLSWQSRDIASGQGERMILLGLFGHSRGMPAGQTYGHLFPLFAYNDANESLITPLFGKWREAGPDGTTFHRYWLTPLVKTSSGATRGWWVLPFYSLSETKDDVFNRVLLLGRYEHTRDGRSAEAGFFPLFDWRREGDLPAALRAMDTGAFDLASQEAVSRDIGWESTWLVWLGNTRHQVTINKWTDPLKAAPGRNTNDVSIVAQTSFEEVRRNRLFPLWSHGSNRTVTFAGTRRTKDEATENRSVLLFLYDSELEHRPAENHEYVRRRVLWHLWHYERLNGDVSMDLFPAITWDRRKDGFSKTSFLWRFFRYEKNPATGTKLDILFIPLMR